MNDVERLTILMHFFIVVLSVLGLGLLAAAIIVGCAAGVL